MFILILSLIFALIVAIFALQNSAPVSLYFLWTQIEVPLVLVILGSALAGALIVFLLALWREFRYRRKQAQGSKAQHENKSLETKNDKRTAKETDSPKAVDSEQKEQEKTATVKDEKENSKS